jgi:hypothetical protein
MAKTRKLDSPELQEILRAEREVLYSSQEFVDESDEKWEKSWDSVRMMAVTVERLRKFPHPIPLRGLDVLPATRIISRLLDYVFVGFGLFVLDSLGGPVGLNLTKVARYFFGDLGLEPREYQYSIFLDPQGWNIFTSNLGAVRKVALLAFALLFFHRLFFYMVCHRTIGQMFSGTMMTGRDGRHPGLASRLLKAVTTSIADASILGSLVDLGFFIAVRPHVSVTDAISGMRAVRYEDWRNLAARLLSKMATIRKEGVLT